MFCLVNHALQKSSMWAQSACASIADLCSVSQAEGPAYTNVPRQGEKGRKLVSVPCYQRIDVGCGKYARKDHMGKNMTVEGRGKKTSHGERTRAPETESRRWDFLLNLRRKPL